MSHPARPNSRKRAKHEEFAGTALVITKQTVSAQPQPLSAAKVISEASTSNSNSIRQSANKSCSPAQNETDGHANLSSADDEEQAGNSPTTATESSPSSTRNMVIHYGKEALCLLAILLTTMASYQGTPKVGRPPTPRHFFPSGTLVHDYPAGNLDAVSQHVSLSELSFVLYYAPWDAASQSARQPFADVAQFYHREAHFSAINCWQPGGECRLQYSRIKAWPVLMAYLPKNGLGVLYNGPWERDPMMRFVNSFLHPLLRINDPDELLQTMTSHDAIVVAFLDLQQDTREWNVFYEAAIKWMYRDPFQDIRFSVVTGESRNKFGVEGTAPVLRMYLWNETVQYENSTWTTTGIENWTLQTVHRVALWMSPSGAKSLSMATFFKNGPVLLFFTPRNMLKESTDAVEMLRQIGMEYYNCHGDEWIREMVREYLPQQRRAHQEELRRLRAHCQGNRAFRSPVSVTFGSLLMNASSSPGEDICLEGDSVFGNLHPRKEESCDSAVECIRGSAPPKMGLRETSLLHSPLDQRSPANLERQRQRRKCELLFIDTEQAAQHSFLGQKPFDLDQMQGIEGMGCSGNRSLTLMLMDSSLYHVFAERLGVDVLAAKRRSALLIVDPENESTYLLNGNEELSLKSIARFIRKFSEGTLRRHLRSSHLDYANTHFYAPAMKGGNSKDSRIHDRTVSVAELNSQNFAGRLGSGRSLLLFFYSSNCAFCTTMSQHLLQMTNILRPLCRAGHLEIVRIDGDKNDLAWPFTVAEYPTLMFLAGSNNSNHGLTGDTRQFAISERNDVALDKVLGFTIANLKRPLRIYAIQLTCAASRRSVRSLVNCMASLRAEIEDGVGASLREWRRDGGLKVRARVVRRLQLLEALYLETFRVSETKQCESCDFTKLERYCKRMVAVWGD